jgi:hypothetical protein
MSHSMMFSGLGKDWRNGDEDEDEPVPAMLVTGSRLASLQTRNQPFCM